MLDLIDAVALLETTGIDRELTIFGDGPQRDALESRIRSTGATERIRLVGSVPHAQRMTELASADILVPASAVESCGMVMVEAMCVGVPTIAAASAGASDIVTNGDTPLRFPIGDVTGLVESVPLLAHHSTLRVKMGVPPGDSWQSGFPSKPTCAR